MSTTAPPELPEPRDARSPYTIALVCLGNICRSPTAHVVLTRKLEDARLDRDVLVSSSGTGTWHLDEPMDRRAAATLASYGYDPSAHRAAQFDATWFDRHDLVLAMDHDNLHDLAAMADDEADLGRLMLFRAFDPLADGELDVPDPFYGGQDGFETVLAIVERTCDALVRSLEARNPDAR
jgi:protein-tyrosine phosphatase